MRHNNCVIFSIFLYFKYSFLSNSFIYKFVHAIIFLFIERKAISCLSVELPRIYQYWIYLIILYNRVQLLIKELLIKKSSVCTWKTKLILTELLMSNNATIAYPFWRKLKNQDVADNKQFWRTVKRYYQIRLSEKKKNISRRERNNYWVKGEERGEEECRFLSNTVKNLKIPEYQETDSRLPY